MEKGPITCHVLDTTRGIAANGILVNLSFQTDDEWTKLAAGQTDSDGRCMTLLPVDYKVKSGTYKLTFHTREYFASLRTKTFFPLIEVRHINRVKLSNRLYRH